MELSEQRRAETGAFYTPKIWADKAVEYMAQTLGNLTDYAFYDPAAGEGALLEALPQESQKMASTLEYPDVQILRAKGFAAAEYDFLKNDDIFQLPFNVFYPGREAVIFTNPPYFKGAKGYAHETYPICKGDATALFLARIYFELPHIRTVCLFHKSDIFGGPSMADFRREAAFKYLNGFICPSMGWPGLKGRFPICFSILRFL